MAVQTKRVLDRVMRDKDAQKQLGQGTRRLNAAYHRARALRGQDAVQDEKLYDHLREAAGALTEAARRFAGKPEPEPEKRSGKLPALAILAGVGLLVRAMHRRQQAAAATDAP